MPWKPFTNTLKLIIAHGWTMLRRLDCNSCSHATEKKWCAHMRWKCRAHYMLVLFIMFTSDDSTTSTQIQSQKKYLRRLAAPPKRERDRSMVEIDKSERNGRAHIALQPTATTQQNKDTHNFHQASNNITITLWSKE